MFILNATSANMLAAFPAGFMFDEITLDEARALAADAKSAVGHADTAVACTVLLGVPVPCQRVNVTLQKGDVALLAQYKGPRLPEGATALPAGATIQWLRVTVR